MPAPKIIKLSNEERVELLKRLSASNLKEEDKKMIAGVVETLQILSDAYDKKNISIKRILKMFFGKKSEKSKDVLKNDDQDKKSPSTNNPPE
ncbi:MAG: hypothetical protein GY714_07090, partial [Desulfobacterales bacterium]|nr:hypothetical protein [Desulfobacterales bacterium]